MFLASNTQIEIPNNGECRVCSKTLYGQRRKFCSVECNNTFHNNENKKPVVDIPRSCVYCSVEFDRKESGLLNYCSKHCQKQHQYSKNKDPYSTYGSGKRKQILSNKYQNWSCCAYDEAVIDNDILEHIEYLATDEPYVQEDMQWLNRVLHEEHTTPRYSDGTVYRPDPLSFKLKKLRLIDWRRPPNISKHRRNRSFNERWSILTKSSIMKRYRKMKYGERKKFMALIKVKST
tara:strand:+ start:2569 stop:3267 length:699 start_codon:yes stop_codon:yes gene_type:complete